MTFYIGKDGKNDVLTGTGADDQFKGFGGADTIKGGGGNDTAFYGDSTEGVFVSLAEGKGYSGTAKDDILIDIDNLGGSAHADTLVGNDDANELQGYGSDDVLKGGGGTDKLYGGQGDDSLKGGGGADVLDGGDGIDTASYNDAHAGVTVTLGSFVVFGGTPEPDTFVSIENLTGSSYDDYLYGNDGNNVLKGLTGNDFLMGGFAGVDVLEGGEGNDTMTAGGATTMIGGVGNDEYIVDGNDVIVEKPGEGIDTVYANVTLTLPQNFENLTLGVGAGAISGTGNGVDNVITGNNFANVLKGEGGQDTLYGGNGIDDLYGGSGADRFVWKSVGETATSGSVDTVWDFGAGDLLDVSGIDGDIYTAGNQAFTFIGMAAFSGAAGEINYYHANGDTYIQLQTGNVADPEAVIRLAGIHDPQASWFVL